MSVFMVRFPHQNVDWRSSLFTCCCVTLSRYVMVLLNMCISSRKIPLMFIPPTTDNTLQRRIPVLDILRGFALCGIIFANLMSFTGFYSLSFSEIQLLPWIDRATLFFIDCFIEGKFYTVFAILLGVGFALQQDKCKGNESKFNRFWLKRMLILMMIGLCHMFFIWHGDILTLYSILGMWLLIFSRLSQKNLLIIIIVLLVTPLVIHSVIATTNFSFWSLFKPIVASLKLQLGYQDTSLLQLRTSSNAVDVFFGNIFSAIPRPMAYLKTGRPFQLLGQFLLGIYLARHYLMPLSDYKRLLTINNLLPSKGVLTYLFTMGVLLSVIYALIKATTGSPFSTDPIGLFQGVVYHLGSIILALSYMIIIIKLAHSGHYMWLNKLSVLGKMSLTQYLIQTSLCVLLFYGYGLGLMGKVPFSSIVFFGVFILFAQYVLGKYWLSKYSIGPMEWLWRRLSYSEKHNKLSSNFK